MGGVKRAVWLAVTCLGLVPAAAWAQGAAVAGVVRDTSGAVLPGVNVEAASPVLIEKVRTAEAAQGRSPDHPARWTR